MRHPLAGRKAADGSHGRHPASHPLAAGGSHGAAAELVVLLLHRLDPALPQGRPAPHLDLVVVAEALPHALVRTAPHKTQRKRIHRD
jgi:hypothetical protein